jgi:GNAT superfamily N-acetyltransferase
MIIDYAETTAIDVDALARLHVDSWRSAYRGMLPDAFLDGPVEANRYQLWQERAGLPAHERPVIITAHRDGVLAGFACVFPHADAEWGALLDNLHVSPVLRGHGIGQTLFERVRRVPHSAGTRASLHLWVLEANAPARRFYERLDGVAVDNAVTEIAPGITVAEIRYAWPAVQQ